MTKKDESRCSLATNYKELICIAVALAEFQGHGRHESVARMKGHMTKGEFDKLALSLTKKVASLLEDEVAQATKERGVDVYN